MRFTKPFLLSGLFAAVIVGGLAAYAVYRPVARPSPMPPAQPTPPLDQTPPIQAPPPERPVVETETYANDQLGFAVEYPIAIVPTEDKPDMALSGYFPICEPDTAVVCFPYGKESLPGRNFDGTAFSVHLRSDLKMQAACEAVGNGEQATGAVTIGDAAFRGFSYSDAALSHQLSGENYRRFQDGRCLQLSTRLATTTFEVYEPGSILRFTDEERTGVLKIINDMRASFRFAAK